MEQAEAIRALERAPTDPRSVREACGALIAEAERHPVDEPEGRRGPAEIAAAAALRCLEALEEGARRDPAVGGHLRIQRANALRLAGHAHDGAAQEAFEEALALAPERAAWHYDAALLHKERGRWRQALEASRRARALGGDGRPVLWNLAIAATALGDGEAAAEAWRALGLPAGVNRAGMPVVEGLDPVQLRVPARGTGHERGDGVPDRAGAFELLWVAPLSPVHGVVQSPAFRDAPVDWGDVVLWDGAPVGVTQVDGKPVPRFPLLEILRRCADHRLAFVGLQQASGEVQRLEGALPEGCLVFVQRERVEHLCTRCAAGEVLTDHVHGPPEEHRMVHGKIIAPADVDLGRVREVIDGVMRSWGTFQIAVPALYEQLGDAKRAGQEHQAWRGIERVAIRKGLMR